MSTMSQLPRSIYLQICVNIIDDTDPLHSLSQRIRTLHAMALVDKEMHALVTSMYPCLIESVVSLSDRVLADRPRLEKLAYLSDSKLRQFYRKNVISSSLEGLGREVMIDNIMDCYKYWPLIPLKRELKRRRSVFMNSTTARHEFRLRTNDLLDQGQIRREDAVDACMNRFKRHAVFLRYDIKMNDAKMKRARTKELKEERLNEFNRKFGRLRPNSVDLMDAERAYVKSGNERDLAAAHAMYAELIDAISNRQNEVDLILFKFKFQRLPANVKFAVDEYVTFNSDHHLAVILNFSCTLS